MTKPETVIQLLKLVGGVVGLILLKQISIRLSEIILLLK